MIELLLRLLSGGTLTPSGTAVPGRTQLRGVTDTALADAVELQVRGVRIEDDELFRLADVSDTMAAAAIETWAEGVRVLSAGEG
jgi:hypothetical protein